MSKQDTNIFEIKAKAGTDPVNLLKLASECFTKNNLYKARFYLESLIKEYPVRAEYLSALGTVYKKLGNLEEAKKWYSKTIEIDPESYEAHYNLGLVFCQEGDTASEINSFLKAIQFNPELYLAYYNIGNAYRKLEQFDKAEKFYKEAIVIKNNFDDAYFNLGVIYERSGKFFEGLECYKKAIEINPKHNSAIWNKALLDLKLENFDDGWEEFEFRKDFKFENTKKITKKLLESQDVNGKRILVYSEQGLGDNIQFSRYLRLLKEKGAYVIFECNPKLFHLFQGHHYIDEIVQQTGSNNSRIAFDYQIALLSLPKYFNTRIENIPAYFPYLYASYDKIQKWKKILSESDELKIGLAWSGAPNNIYGKDRSCPLNALLPLLFINGVKFYSLQKSDTYNPSIDESIPVTVFSDIDSIPFVDSAAIIQNLDMVISIDTSIAHLAGAMGKETWVMLPYYSDWRWFINRDSSPWYPTMKLFRQTKNGDWDGLINRIKDKLQHKLSLKNISQDFALN